MAQTNHNEPNYWKILSAAENALHKGDFATGEYLYHEAAGRRAGSPGRVFISEKLTDGFKSLLKQTRRREDESPSSPGRWDSRTSAFRKNFLVQGEPVVRQGVRLAELRPEDDAATNQPVLEAALFLVARSRIFQEEATSAVPLLKGLFLTAGRTGQPFDFNLVRHDLPLTEEDRLWLAKEGGALFDVFIQKGNLAIGSSDSGEWARVVLSLLQPRYFGSTSRLEEERSWLEAVTSDRLLGRAAASVELYRAYLGIGPETGPRADEARVRLLELLGNTDAVHFSVPRYHDAYAAMAEPDPASGKAVALRYHEARARVEYRRPATGRQTGSDLAWVSLAPGLDDQMVLVFWWDNEPRDVATWRPGEDITLLEEWLLPCENRLVAFETAEIPQLQKSWKIRPPVWSVRDFMVATMESRMPAEGLDPDTVLGLCLAETGPWRTGWDTGSGHPDLAPPRSSSLVESWDKGPAAGALLAGLAWLAVRNEVAGADPALRAGLGELARRGDPASVFLYGFIGMDSHGGRGLDSSFQPWTLPLLWTRPDPFGWSATGMPTRAEKPAVRDPQLRPDLGRNDLAIVSTGDPTTVLAAWGDGYPKWRVVLDRLDRLESVARVSGGVIGPVTLIPPSGTVHCLASSLDYLEYLLLESDPEENGLLPMFHWVRLVATHNGDLLDFRQVRPRSEGKYPLYERYAEVLEAMDREEPRLDPDGHLDTWAGQFSQRVRKAGLVAGPVDHLAVTPERLDSLWGVFEGSDASWAFLDSAAVHWSLLHSNGPGIQEIHALLFSRGKRHLSLLTGGVWLRQELETLLGTWLGVFGNPYFLSLTDMRPPALRLAGRGVQPEAEILAGEALASQATWLDRALAETQGGWIQMPAMGRSSAFWNSVSTEEVVLAKSGWRFLPAKGQELTDETAAGGLLAIPALASLELDAMPVAGSDSRADWVNADEARNTFFAWRRKVCALEIAACLAGPWDTVAILDNRWLRLLAATPGLGTDPGAFLPRAADETARLATDGTARTMDLPGSDPRGRYPVDVRIQAVVNGWLMTQDKVDRSGAVGSAPADGALVPARGTTLLLGDVAPVWQGIAARVAEDWERGLTDTWILLVADEVPTGAAGLVAAAGTAGRSIWAGGQNGGAPSPLVWVEPEDFSDPRLVEYLAEHRPSFIVAGDVADWKPGPEREAQETALALRAIMECRAETVILHSRGKNDPWIRYLVASCDARFMGSPESEASTPDPAVGVGVDTSCLDCGQVSSAEAMTRRLGALLGRLRELTNLRDASGEESETKPPEWQLMPLTWLGILSGLPNTDVAEGVLLLRWAARLAGDSLSSAGSEKQAGSPGGQGHQLLISRRFADFEQILDQLEQNLGVLLPLWLGSGHPGLLNWIDMEFPPARIQDDDLEILDRFLLWNGSVSDPGKESKGLGDPGLTYVCPRGSINSTQRLVGCRGPSADVLQQLVRRLSLFRARIEDVMDGALETGDGFLVETGLNDLRTDERSFLGLGTALGFWKWSGPVCPDAIHLVDLLTVADSPTVRQSSHGWALVRDEASYRYAAGVGQTGAAILESAQPETGRGLRSLRSLLAGGAEQRDDLDPVVSRVAELVRGNQGAGFLVLKGVFGSGRHEALGRGLMQACRDRGEFLELTVYCPDQAVAAMISREFLRLGMSGPFDVRVPSGDSTRPDTKSTQVSLVDPSSALVVICEAQRFDPETRYRIAQTGRGRKLVMTVDPAAAVEPWEHLFLTTPRADDVVDLPGQRKAARKIWSEIRELVPPEHRNGTVQRRDKGELISDYAANLDQCLSRVAHEHKEGKLRTPLRVTAPMPGDLEYLGSSIRDRGWLVVLETRLEGLLLPGVREFLAAATDHLTLGGHFDSATRPTDPVATAESVTAPGEVIRPDLLLPRILGPQGAAAWNGWVTEIDPASDPTLQEFAELVAPTAWANTFLSRPEARLRITRLLDQYGGELVSSLPTLPLWEAWWYTMLDDLSARGPGHRRPLAVLTSAARPLGAAQPGAAYLCLGTESPRQHYESLVRATDSLLILYQEKSPLPSESPR